VLVEEVREIVYPQYNGNGVFVQNVVGIGYFMETRIVPFNFVDSFLSVEHRFG